MKKLLFITVLIFCLLGTTQTAYSYFDSSTPTILNEDGQLYTIIESSNKSSKQLIPLGCILSEDETYYIIYQYDVYIEKGMNIESAVTNLALEGSSLNEEELNKLFNFDILIDHRKDVQLSHGMFYDNSNGELVHIIIEVTMNNIDDFNNSSTIVGQNLSFTYLLTVSKPLS
jgi:hypothetical protein